LCTTEYVAGLALIVGGDEVSVLTLITGQNDPHSYHLVKGDDTKFRMAELIFCSGLMLEQGTVLERYLKRYSACAIGDYIQHRTNGAIVMGTIYDPHIWNDMHLWAYGLFLVADELSKIRPEKSGYFQKNAMDAFDRYQRLHKKFRDEMQRIDKRRRYLVTTHDAFSYFCRAYVAPDDEIANDTWKLRCMAPEGFAPESQISTKDLLRVIDYIIEHDVHSVFAEVGVNHDSIQKVVDICREKGCNVTLRKGFLYSDTMGPHSTYEDVMKHNIDVVATSFMES
jgi:manganese/zinc/iron transport system substrate-binding protein